MRNQKPHRLLVTFFFVLTPPLFAASGLSIFPKKTFPGGVILVKMAIGLGESSESHPLTVNNVVTEWSLCPRTKTKSLCAFVGLPMDDTPPLLEIKVGELSEKIPVVAKKYPKSNLRVATKHADVSPENQARIDKEKEVLKSIFLQGSNEYLWKTNFQLPCKGGPMSPFGAERLFNDKVASVHYGLDLRANKNTAIRSTNAGRVVFVGNLFNAGNYVAIDHGGGVFSTYSHLTSYAVKIGDLVKNGQKIGMAGATGRVTGPHLHWSIRINGLYVDPAEFIKVAKEEK